MAKKKLEKVSDYEAEIKRLQALRDEAENAAYIKLGKEVANYFKHGGDSNDVSALKAIYETIMG